ncbi:hypothetical protein B4U80_13428 [Leptotrombidium deliense]|uniref:Terpene synthase n=1 Tax=Leptotrombidium deliense TaxID=299467 RepID=A0A443S6K0_9ACAR|nr:hypothetical protein B4U80_13428 [Leptotrombidium deliense]
MPTITAFMYPWASVEKCVVASKIITLFTIIDDFTEERNQEDEAKMLIQRIIEIIENNETVKFSSKFWFEAAMSDVWQEFQGAPVSWREDFKSTITTLMMAFFEETKQSNVPTFDEYFTLRLITVGIQLPQMMIEFAAEKYLSNSQRSNLAFQANQATANYIIMTMNDIFSFSREVKTKFNLIILFMKHEKLDEKDARNKLIEYMKRNIQLYLKQREMLSLYPKSTEWYLKYVDQLVRGAFDFHKTVPRYKL